MKKIFLTAFMCASYCVTKSQNLDSMLASQRDSILISIAKEVVLIYGPDYYRDYFPPIVERYVVPPKGEINPTGEMAGRVLYWVTFLYDRAEERLAESYAAKVSFWADAGGMPVGISFGNGFGLTFPEDTEYWRNTTAIRVPYQNSIVPLYDINNPDPNQEPVNKDELLRKGMQRVAGTDRWERTRPDAPPAEAQRAIRRAQDDMRRREVEREKNRDRQK